MDIMELGAIGELVGGVAVIASLVYVGLQVGQGNRLARAAVVRSQAEANVDFLKILCSDSEMTRLYLEGASARDELSRERRTQFDLCMTVAFRTGESQFFERRDGYLSMELWKSWERRLTGELCRPGIMAYWQRNKNLFSKAFIEYVEQLPLDPAEA